MSGSILSRTFRGVALVVAGLLLTAPVSAHVGHGTYRIETVDLTAAPGAWVGGYVACQRNKRAISGGALWHRQDQDVQPSLTVWLTDSTITSDGKGYYAAGWNLTDTETLRLTITVICLASSSVGSYTLRTKELDIAHPDFGGGYVACPKGKRIVGGGAYWHEDPDTGPGRNSAYLTASTPTSDGKGWYASGRRAQSNPVIRLRLQALCVPKAKVATYTLRTETFDVPDGFSFGQFFSCPKGKRVVAGGAYWSDIPNRGPDYRDNVRTTSSTPTSDGLGWYAQGTNLTGQTAGFTIKVLCLKPR